MTTPLCPAHLLTLDGTDAVAFAHAQFTSDVRTLSIGEWQWSAWLDPQGRARAVFALLRPRAEHLVAWQPLGDAVAMRDALRRFVFRSAVRIEAGEAWALHRATDAPPAMRALELRHDGYLIALPGTNTRAAWIGPRSGEDDPGALAAWRREDIAAGLPLLATPLAGEFVPQALDLERIDAIRFDKGCYPGQEVAARLHFRGGNKRRLQRISIAGGDPEPGAAVSTADGVPVGRTLYSAPLGTAPGRIAMAVLNDAAIDAATRLSVSGVDANLCD
jgi:folate-binding protein YgfZ